MGPVTGLEVGRSRRRVRAQVTGHQRALGLTAEVRATPALLNGCATVCVPQAECVANLVHDHRAVAEARQQHDAWEDDFVIYKN